jgi:hypothetical protein
MVFWGLTSGSRETDWCNATFDITPLKEFAA